MELVVCENIQWRTSVSVDKCAIFGRLAVALQRRFDNNLLIPSETNSIAPQPQYYLDTTIYSPIPSDHFHADANPSA